MIAKPNVLKLGPTPDAGRHTVCKGTLGAFTQSMAHLWQPRGPDRPADGEWSTTIRRVRAEFEEMPGLRVTPAQARALFGLPDGVLGRVLDSLSGEGFLEERDGEYVRRHSTP